jgi:hypothetical protein
MERQLFSISALAPELGLDRRTLGDKLRGTATDGITAGGKPGYYLATVIQAVFAGGSATTKAQILEEQLEALRAERRIREGRWAAVEVFESCSRHVLVNTKTALSGMSRKLAPYLSRARTAEECDAIVRKEVTQILNRLSQGEYLPNVRLVGDGHITEEDSA